MEVTDSIQMLVVATSHNQATKPRTKEAQNTFARVKLAEDLPILTYTFSPLPALSLAASLAKILALLASDFALASEIGDSAIITSFLMF
jgi:hypothetical protein